MSAPRRHYVTFSIEVLDWLWELAKRSVIVGALTVLSVERNNAALQQISNFLAILLWMWAGLSFARVLFPDIFGPGGDPDANRPAWKQVAILVGTLAGAAVAFFFAEIYVGKIAT